MAEKDEFEDEYQFTDVDAIGPGGFDESEDEAVQAESAVEARKQPLAAINIRRNALIALAMIVLALVVYKFLGSYFATEKPGIDSSATKTKMPEQTPKPVQKPLPQPQQLQPRPEPATVSPKLDAKLGSLESSQENIQSQVGSISNQLGGMNSNMSALSSQIENLSRAVSSLNEKLDTQARDIDQLAAQIKRTKKPPKQVVKPQQPKKYYLKALIPGRAWLIAPNGSTLTVSIGSHIPGYGKVKLIDPHQGSVVTSSGHTIRFSQADS